MDPTSLFQKLNDSDKKNKPAVETSQFTKRKDNSNPPAEKQNASIGAGLQIRTSKPVVKLDQRRRSSVPVSEKSVNFISDYMKRRAHKVIEIQKQTAESLNMKQKQLCSFKIVPNTQTSATQRASFAK